MDGTELKSRQRFTPEEDARLDAIVRQLGASKWRLIASFLPGKTARQCRDRYQNYLNPKYKNEPWTLEEDMLLYQKIQEVGPTFRALAPFFPDRSKDNINNKLKNWVFSNAIKEIKVKKTSQKRKTDEFDFSIESLLNSKKLGINMNHESTLIRCW